MRISCLDVQITYFICLLSDDISYSLVLTGPPPPLPPLQPSGMDAPPNSATSSVPTVVTTGIHHQPPPAPPSLFTAGAVFALSIHNVIQC